MSLPKVTKLKKSKKELKKLISIYLERIKSKKKCKPIFSGDGSKGLWASINKINKMKKKRKIKRAAWNAIYTLGCRCQDLEARVNMLMLYVYSEGKNPPAKEEENVT